MAGRSQAVADGCCGRRGRALGGGAGGWLGTRVGRVPRRRWLIIQYMMRSWRRSRSWAVTLAVAAAVAASCFGGAFFLQAALLLRPARGSAAALRAAMWFNRHRLVESSIQINRHKTRGRCANSWFHVPGRRPASGTVFRLADGFTLLVVPPHRVETAGGTGSDQAISPLVDLELGGCSQLLARFLQADAQNRRILGLRREISRGSVVLALTVPIDATRLTLYLDPKNYRPVSLVAVTSRGFRGMSQIHFARLTTSVLRILERSLPTAGRLRLAMHAKSTSTATLTVFDVVGLEGPAQS